MSLPITPPLEPMLARSQPTIPPGMAYEPKWDGFRCLVFRDQEQVSLFSRNGLDLTRYFPEMVAAVRAELPPRCVVDGELVVIAGDRLDFDLLSQRIHPAQSRITRLAAEWPTTLVCWDLLCLDDEVLLDRPFTERRHALQAALIDTGPRVRITPVTTDLAVAELWFAQFEGAGLDGIVAKPLAGTYQPGKRAMVKVKHAREADVVVAGFRLHRMSTPQLPLVGSLQLGLYSPAGLQFVGAASAFSQQVRAELATRYADRLWQPGRPHPWAEPAADVRRPGEANRWTSQIKHTSLIWPLEVCTVGYEHLQGTRFRHAAQFKRWRPDRDPSSCTFDQLDAEPRFRLSDVLSPGPGSG